MITSANTAHYKNLLLSPHPFEHRTSMASLPTDPAPTADSSTTDTVLTDLNAADSPATDSHATDPSTDPSTDLPIDLPTHLEIPIPETLTYAARIHYASTCRCHRIPKNLPSQTVAGCDLIFVVERDRSFKNRNTCPCFFNICIDSESTFTDAHQQLVTVFKDSLDDRSIIYDYFKVFGLEHTAYAQTKAPVVELWHHETARLVRDLTLRVPPVLLCNSDLSFCKQQGWNGGCIVLGDRSRLDKIASIFNRLVTKTEFQSLRALSIRNLHKSATKSDPSVHALRRNIHSSNLKEIPDLFTLLGVSTRDKLYSTSFGKREWYDRAIECSKQCAMRELFEEFNIQLSPTTLANSREWLDTNYITDTMIWSRGAIFYVVYISPSTPVTYDPISETICVGY